MSEQEETAHTSKFPPYVLIGGAILIIVMAVFVYQTFALRQTISEQLVAYERLETRYENLEMQSSQSLEAATTTIAALREELTITEEELDDLEEDYRDERDRNEEFEDQLNRLGETVGTLDKLSKTDEELLQKYSRVYFLNENYIPSDLDEIESRYVHDSKDDAYFHADAMEYLEEMMREARRENIDIDIISAYRSFDEQREVKNGHTTVFGEGANTFSADQGYSEHQLGTTVDFGTSELSSAVDAFANTEAFQWLLDNAYKYGFILSYPEGNSFYVFEPWHWRFVGRDLARDLERADENFYDWEQRKIDEYLVEIFE